MAIEVVGLTAQLNTDADYVEREGPIFEAGDYEHQQFSMTSDELQAAVAAFKPVDLELEHYDSQGMPNILSGKLGQVVEAWLGEDGQTLIGRTRIPRWLHDLHQGEPIKVSSVFRRGDKQLERVGLVLRPQIPTAAVFSAY